MLKRNESFERKSRIRAIKACQRDLQMDDDTYRAVLKRVSLARVGAEIDSSAKMPLPCLYAVLDELRRLGARRKPAAGRHSGYPSVRPNAMPLIAKIEAQLTEMQLPWAYARAILKRGVSASVADGHPGVDRLEWATPEQLQKVVAALAYEQEKRRLAQRARTLLAESGRTEADVPRLVTGAPENWHRNLRCLRYLVALLEREALRAER